MKLTVYSTNSCGYCHMLKAWLSEKNVSFTDVKVDEDQNAAREMVALSGQMGVPFSVIEKDDGTTVGVLGFDRAQLASLLGV